MSGSLRRYSSLVQTLWGGVRLRKVLLFLFFLFISATFWLLQTLNETLEVEVSVPVQLKNVPSTVVVTTELPPEVKVVLSDRGTSLVRFFRHKGLSPIVLDFANYDHGQESDCVRFQQSDVSRMLQLQLESSTHIQGVEPDTLEFYYTRNHSRRLPVVLKGQLKAAPQNYLLSVRCTPDSVDVYGPSAMIDTMQCACTETLDMEGLTETFTREVALLPFKGLKYSQPSVSLAVAVDYYMERSVEVPILGLNFPPDRQLRTFPSKATVTFRVGAVKADRNWEEYFVLAATYEELLQAGGTRYMLHLKSVPSDISNVRISPMEVDYLIEQTVKSESETEGE